MTALAPIEPNSKKLEGGGPDAPSPAAGLFTHLLGTMGNEAVASVQGQAAGIGRHGASPALAKRTSKSVASTDPTQMAVAEMSTRSAPKATVQAAERESKLPSGVQYHRDQAGPTRPQHTSENQVSRPEEQLDSRGKAGEPSAAAPSSTAARTPESVSGAVSGAASAQAARSRPLNAQVNAAAGAAARVMQMVAPVGQLRAQVSPHSAIGRAFVAQRGPSPSVEKAAAKVTPQPAPPNPEAEFAEQLGRGMSAIMRQNGGSLTLRLQPDSLGELTIRMELQPGKVAATFEVDSDQARQLLDAHMTTLRSALEAKGLGVESLAVQVSDKGTAQDAPLPMDVGNPHGGAGNPGGGATGEGGGGAGTDRQLAQASAGQSRSEDQLWPEAGAEGEETGGAQVIRLVLDAVA